MTRPDLVDEHQARAAAGLTLAFGAVAFAYAALGGIRWPIRCVAVLFAVDFAVRVVDRLEHSPTGVVARWLTHGRAPFPVSARPKRFAWTLGCLMATAMAVLTNVGVRGMLNKAVCIVCLGLMWAEAALGLCLGCELYGFLVRRGLIGRRAGYDICASGACAIPPPDLPAQLVAHDGRGLDHR
jgi:hypothetical protein